MRSALLLLCVAALSGCLSRESRHAEKLEGRYQLGDPGDGWRPVQPGGADFAFLNRDLGATMYADSNCGSRFEDAPLPDMVKHQLFGVVDPKAAPLHEAWTTLDGREAYTTRRAGILDGVAVELGVTVLKKDTCVYDLVVIASPGERFEQAWAGYQSMVQGFPDPAMTNVLKLLAHMGGVASLTWRTFKSCFTPPFIETRLLVTQMDQAGIGSWSIAVLTALFTGAVLAIQFAKGLEPYGASLYTGKMVSLGMVRELGPTLTAVLVGGRVGAGFTAEIGSMKVTEQVDAISALGADPVRKLVVPRVVACLIMLPLLTVLADFVGCLGGMLITMSEVGLTARFFFEQVIDTLSIEDLMHGLMKSFFFGYFIAIIGCYVGLNVRGGTEGVGRSTTDAVVAISITVLVSNFMLTKVFMGIYG